MQRESVVVVGRVVEPGGRAISQARVTLFVQRLAVQTVLSTETVQPDGSYRIQVPGDAVFAGTAQTALIRAKAFFNTQLLGQVELCALQCEAIELPDIITDIAVNAFAPPEYRVVKERIACALGSEKLAHIGNEGIPALSCTSGVAQFLVNTISRVEQQHELTPLGEEVLYGLAREGIAIEPGGLLRYPLVRIRAALEQSIRGNIISRDTEEQIDRVTAQLARLAHERGVEARCEPFTIRGTVVWAETGSASVG